MLGVVGVLLDGVGLVSCRNRWEMILYFLGFGEGFLKLLICLNTKTGERGVVNVLIGPVIG